MLIHPMNKMSFSTSLETMKIENWSDYKMRLRNSLQLNRFTLDKNKPLHLKKGVVLLKDVCGKSGYLVEENKILFEVYDLNLFKFLCSINGSRSITEILSNEEIVFSALKGNY